MANITKKIVIDAPLEGVFSYASQWQNWVDFFEGAGSFEPTTKVTRGNGARYAYKAKMIGLKVAAELEIKDFIENKGWCALGTKGVSNRINWEFAKDNNTTEITYTLEYKVPIPILGALLDRLFIKKQWEGIIERSLSNLKARF
ncbi:MAG: SRPBCC family protein [Candidatus Omnitrophota bacterium]